MGRISTVSCALLLAALGSPSTVLVTLAVLVKLPSASGRITSTATDTFSPGASVPPFCVQVTVPLLLALQLKVAVLPPDTTGVRAPKVVRPVRKPGTLSVKRTPVAPSTPGLTLLTTRV